MNKQTILKTAVCRFDDKDLVYIVQSPLFNRLIGADRSAQKAWAIYHDLLNDMWEAYLEGRLADRARPGRPAKGILNVNVQVSPEIRESLRENAKALGISQGDFVSFAITLAEAHLAKHASEQGNKTAKKSGEKNSRVGNKKNAVSINPKLASLDRRRPESRSTGTKGKHS